MSIIRQGGKIVMELRLLISCPWGGEMIILDDPSGSNVITRVLISGNGRQKRVSG